MPQSARRSVTLAVVIEQQEQYQEESVVIVAGAFTVDPAQREAFLEGRKERMRTSRAERGCLEYTFSADPLDPGRVVLYERWASQEDLDAHLAAPSPPSSSGTDVEPTSVTIMVYDVAGERPLRG